MKRSFLLIFTVFIAFTSCKQTIRYTQNATEIDTYKELQWEDSATYYAEAAKILNNVIIDNVQSVSQFIEQNKKDAKHFTFWRYNAVSFKYEIAMIRKSQTPMKIKRWLTSRYRETFKKQILSTYESIVNDRSETWINFWGHGEGLLKSNEKRNTSIAHMAAQFLEGKTIRKDGYWDVSRLMMDIQT